MPESIVPEPITAESVGRLEFQVSDARGAAPTAFCACIHMQVICLCSAEDGVNPALINAVLGCSCFDPE